jgi:hypothetical protein
MIYDAFNGDADGICALHQLRLADPRKTTLITGVKRDIGLLKQIKAVAGDEVNALDIAVEKNIAVLTAMLENGVKVRWFDHHNPGELPVHPNFAGEYRYRRRCLHQPAGGSPSEWQHRLLGSGRRLRRQPACRRAPAADR